MFFNFFMFFISTVPFVDPLHLKCHLAIGRIFDLHYYNRTAAHLGPHVEKFASFFCAAQFLSKLWSPISFAFLRSDFFLAHESHDRMSAENLEP